ncbi:MAG: hypothetical protein BGO25_14405 [Acidobacteriales bacterium 59-55]|nr:MAG: hypothetical protein BGO25_14405 [Acidobacteriales bacterium 59-55]
MAWHDDPTHPFAGIAEKVVRAEENILNLNAEIERFFNEGDYPAIPENDFENFSKAIEYHKNCVIPPKFSVLAGEIVHHLRSCFDHIVWHFSTGPQINKMPVDFPVFCKKPIDKGDVTRFEGKIQKITNSDVRVLIERLQPYNAADPMDDPLWLIHDFDIIDKHRELLLCLNAGIRLLPNEMKPIIESYERAHPELDPAKIAFHFKGYGVLQPCIAFRDFGKRKIQPATPGLLELLQYTVDVVGGFAEL